MVEKQVTRCQWVTHYRPSETMVAYHDVEWGHPIRQDDRLLFELLTLEIFQAGLSWEIALNKRAGLKQAFKNFDLTQVSQMTAQDEAMLRNDATIIRNRLKIAATVNNAHAIKRVQAAFGSFSNYMWQFTNGQVIDHHVTDVALIPAQNELSQSVAKDMKQRGFKFAGPVTIYSFLQGMGVINDHEESCTFKYHQ
ncbi:MULTISPECIES: DNA-3-methyladenine glycosylase I [Leuconostoc]|uniref:3-methyladenine DNA glycosylase n=1 Tax=Leuconostoc garlicum TaxID=255248 RepID=A0ABN4WMK5_9LACO|nr:MULTISPECIES: DNA-3-methyladenine glycosylase I [Leuconostoc]AQN79491.1 3-methyladenine DNA glycosylase [Leuconostoc garlicum]MCT8387859.1 DNA-3-methyladenine glycosylase I [Leuconostoc lactis]MDN2650290.1 DNA-3-methyladenine glycosylase I [Leuconostoc lactis]GEB39623.1 putative 3-methyl-adenine DNA glycosylase I, constitutive [Leuconostoc lactis]GLY44793.1 putative 3-methyl-adenine DNA glycosylase I, constitutive [Leuconostoc lactis]